MNTFKATLNTYIRTLLLGILFSSSAMATPECLKDAANEFSVPVRMLEAMRLYELKQPGTQDSFKPMNLSSRRIKLAYDFFGVEPVIAKKDPCQQYRIIAWLFNDQYEAAMNDWTATMQAFYSTPEYWGDKVAEEIFAIMETVPYENEAERIRAELPREDYELSVGSSTPVEIKSVSLIRENEELYSSGGGFYGGGSWDHESPDSAPSSGKHYSIREKNLIPQKITAEWFSYASQKFYTAEIALSDDLLKLINELKITYGENDTSEPEIILGLGPNGEIKAALMVSCSYIYKCGRNEKLTAIGSGIGKETTGDPKVYLPITRELINEGRIAPISGTEE